MYVFRGVHHLALKVELLHFLLTVPDANKCAGLCLLLRAALSLHLLLLLLPAAAHQVHTRRRAEEPEHNMVQTLRSKLSLMTLMREIYTCPESLWNTKEPAVSKNFKYNKDFKFLTPYIYLEFLSGIYDAPIPQEKSSWIYSQDTCILYINPHGDKSYWTFLNQYYRRIAS